MRIYDPLYGAHDVPEDLCLLLNTPEVRRLSQVRLLNCLSPSLATLGELRRYSHTLGVLFLSTRNTFQAYSGQERRALAAAVLLHDIGTPPFGHLMEYHLREKTGWNHEQIIKSVLTGCHAPENRAHQIFAGRSIEFRTALQRGGFSIELVEAIITAQHPLSRLLFGTMDLDNLDNVARMAWALGFGADGSQIAVELAAALQVDSKGVVSLDEQAYGSVVQRWMSLRTRAYDVLAFDPPTVSAQAVLSEAIGLAMSSEIIDEDDWSLSDEGLLDKLRGYPETKQAITREFFGRLPTMAFCAQIFGSLSDLGISSRGEGKNLIEEVIRSHFPSARALGYIFIDRGAFEKQLTFRDTHADRDWGIGCTSQSIVFYGFVRGRLKLSQKRCAAAAEDFIQRLRIPETSLKRCIVGETAKSAYAPRSFGFSASKC